MIAALVNHLWQSTLFALAAGALTVAFRNNRAHVRYWLWLSASLKFLLPFSVLLSLGSHFVPANIPIPTQVTPAASAAILQITQPLSPTPLPVVSNETHNWVPIAVLALWACGFLAVLLIRFRGYRRIRAAIRASNRIELPLSVDVRSSSSLFEPGVFGVLRPVLLLPQDIEKRLTPAQFEAVVAHELCHVRRNDNLTASLHMIVEAAFWFHPLVWWIGARLLEERERACDEAVLSLGSAPRDYAEGILNVCKTYLESPLQAFSGVTGSDLKGRIHAILRGRVALDLNRTKKAVLAITAIAVLAAPIAIGIMNAPAIRAQSAVRPQFEVASLKPNNGCENIPRAGNLSPSPGLLEMPCVTLQGLIQAAYGTFRNGATIDFGLLQMEGGPSWMQSEHYSLTAKADGPVRTEMLAGPMLQAFLQDRFQLKTHLLVRDAPIYAMTVAKGGLKVQPLAEGSCTPIDLTHPPAPPKPGDPLPNLCGAMIMRPAAKGNIRMEVRGATMVQLAQRLSARVDRPVIDTTGIGGQFNFPLDFTADPNMPGQAFPPGRGEEANSEGPNLFVALQEQLGLKLSPDTGSVGILIIDHAEKPSAN
ncbi:MAG TPA: M56 family metallopeptidase [Bryobacteraceae bacterium]|jgi:bla regulator protein BlaR1|nr:M56 family metallopeptidase [Bryobacteraceae bacterium]